MQDSSSGGGTRGDGGRLLRLRHAAPDRRLVNCVRHVLETIHFPSLTAGQQVSRSRQLPVVRSPPRTSESDLATTALLILSRCVDFDLATPQAA